MAIRFVFAFAALALSGPTQVWAAPDDAADASAATETTPLFAEDGLLPIELIGPVRSIARAAPRSTRPYAAKLVAAGESHAIMLSARGVSRRIRVNCDFPPMRIELAAKPAPQSLFARQSRMKLVTHCRDRDSFEAAVMREYIAYRLYSLVTPQALKARLVQVTYRDGSDTVTTRRGFLIEDIDDAARRVGLREISTGTIRPSALDTRAAARFAMFQYMIGNTDFAMLAGPNSGECCHNAKLLASDKNARSGLVPVPYDFDNSGIVNASYAMPSEKLPVRNVRQRLYRGFCHLNPLAREEAAKLVALRPDIMREIATSPALDDGSRRQMSNYLEAFFDIASDPEKLEQRAISRCR
ncbi:hypothetical protein ACXYL9_03000 [Qipengyuania sp. CAU 1752]